MDISLFNIQDGFLEAVCRGMRSGFLTDEDYNRLGLAETLEDLKAALEDTGYGQLFHDDPGPITLETIGIKLRDRLAVEYRFLREQADYPLQKFLDFAAREKMIDNVIAIIQGAIKKKSSEYLLEKLDPVGWFPELKTVAAMDISTSYEEVYRILLIDTPIGPYFDHYLKIAHPQDMEGRGMADVSTMLNEIDIELLRTLLKKIWLEEFYQYVKEIGGTTFEVMGHLLKREADFRILAVTLNAISTGATINQLPDMTALYPSIGYLYPEGIDRLRKAWNDPTIRSALEHVPLYLNFYDQCKNFYIKEEGELLVMSDDTKFKSIEDLLYAEIVAQSEMAFEQQFHYGIYYAYLKLKEQEIRNILWIADMVIMKRKDQTGNIIPIFSPRI